MEPPGGLVTYLFREATCSEYHTAFTTNAVLSLMPFKENFHTSTNHFVVVGARMKGNTMIDSLTPEFVRLQRGIKAFDPRRKRAQAIFGGVTMALADIPAASGVIFNQHTSNCSCCNCLFNIASVTSWQDVASAAAPRSE
ncbi:hypothetical protein K470DRAFT_136065 [Piedraia hortae CBS 480.64]|uniref:Uncharacterized protein n=1 Tax=Piedraia hortae CBS 480.64 TaxID=1314780 RepID=A0A6A7BU97_9PEZI|nr:hypothetical protein K470DRAFT_136065 [Piedraia hortae CBS 480.64]